MGAIARICFFPREEIPRSLRARLRDSTPYLPDSSVPPISVSIGTTKPAPVGRVYFLSPTGTLHGGLVEGVTRPLPSIRHQSVAEHPADDAGIVLISASLGKRLLVPELVRRRPVRQLEQQRRADVVGAVSRADRSAKDEAVAVRGEV